MAFARLSRHDDREALGGNADASRVLIGRQSSAPPRERCGIKTKILLALACAACLIGGSASAQVDTGPDQQWAQFGNHKQERLAKHQHEKAKQLSKRQRKKAKALLKRQQARQKRLGQ